MLTRIAAPAQDRGLSADGSPPYRFDIDGVRALAIFLVVVYHVWLGRVSGGVDVFLMISAFFLTSSFARRAQNGADLHIVTYWLRKFRRLMPAAAVAIVGILAAVYLWFSPTTWPTMWRQATSSLFYVQNWELAASNVDYYARSEQLPSPFQHFWSLSVQGQVFILWPLIFLGVALIVRHTRLRAKPLLIGVFSAIFAASLWFSIVETYSSQSFAYFDTRTRLWEFAAGSLVALLLPHLRVSTAARVVLGWLGVIGIVLCGLVLDVQGGFPGYLALWPVMCTAAIIVAGTEDARWSPTRLLASRPMRFLGRDAYALYLVHWPILITFLSIRGETRVGFVAGSGLILLSMVVARAVSWGVENPLRRLRVLDRKPVLNLAVIASCVAIVIGPLTAWKSAEQQQIAAIVDVGTADYPGATVLSDPSVLTPTDVPLRPIATQLKEEWVALDGVCTGDRAPSPNSVLDGTCIERVSRDGFTKTVVAVGDSHTQQWLAAVMPIAEERDWTVVALLKGACSFALDEPWSESAEDCVEWRTAAIEYIDELDPALVFGMATKSVPDSPEEHMLAGLAEAIEAVADEGTQAVLFRDNPRFTSDMYQCALLEPAERADCTRNRDDVLAATSPIAGLPDSVEVIDLSDTLCPDGVCEPVIGNLAVYLDKNHLTQTFARTLAPEVEVRLREARLLSD